VLKEADKLRNLTEVQKEEMEQEARCRDTMRGMQSEMFLMKTDRESTTEVLSKLVEKLCPDKDPTKLYC
jgi:hypothetical protein